MENKLNWNLKELFEDENDLENSIKMFYELLDKIKTFKGRLGNSVDEMYEYFNSRITEMYSKPQTGIFQADMKVKLINDGPSTFLLTK